MLAGKADLKMDLITTKSFTEARCPRIMPAPTILSLFIGSKLGSWKYKIKAQPSSTPSIFLLHSPWKALPICTLLPIRSKKNSNQFFLHFLIFFLYKLQTWNSTYLQVRTKILNATSKGTPDRVPSQTLKRPGGRTAMRKSLLPFSLIQQSTAALLPPEISLNSALQDINILAKFSTQCCAYHAPYNARPQVYDISQS